MSDSVQPHRRQPTRLPLPWDSPGKNTGVGCHFLLQCMKVKVKGKLLSGVRLLATPWTAAHQAPPSMGFSRQEYWSGVPLPSPIYIWSPALQEILYFLSHCLVAQMMNLPVNAGNEASIPWSGRSPGGGNGNPLQYSCLGNPLDRGAWWAIVHGVTKELDMTEQLNNNPISYKSK